MWGNRQMNHYVEPPWRKSKSDNVYCALNDVPNEIRSNLIVEDKYLIEIGKYSYKVRVFNDNVLVFRERTGENKRTSYCKICAQNGFPNIPIRWQNSDGKWDPHDYDNPSELHAHLRAGYDK
jgi:hypothetical protein